MSQQRTQLSCWYSFLLGRTLYVSLSPLSVHKHLIMFIETQYRNQDLCPTWLKPVHKFKSSLVGVGGKQPT